MSTAITTSRSPLSVENYQDGGQLSARRELGIKIRRHECRRLSEMAFQVPRQPVAVCFVLFRYHCLRPFLFMFLPFFISLEMSFFPSMFTITVLSFYGEYIVRFSLPDVFFSTL